MGYDNTADDGYEVVSLNNSLGGVSRNAFALLSDDCDVVPRAGFDVNLASISSSSAFCWIVGVFVDGEVMPARLIHQARRGRAVKGAIPAQSAEQSAMQQLKMRSESGPSRASSPAAFTHRRVCYSNAS